MGCEKQKQEKKKKIGGRRRGWVVWDGRNKIKKKNRRQTIIAALEGERECR